MATGELPGAGKFSAMAGGGQGGVAGGEDGARHAWIEPGRWTGSVVLSTCHIQAVFLGLIYLHSSTWTCILLMWIQVDPIRKQLVCMHPTWQLGAHSCSPSNFTLSEAARACMPPATSRVGKQDGKAWGLATATRAISPRPLLQGLVCNIMMLWPQSPNIPLSTRQP